MVSSSDSSVTSISGPPSAGAALGSSPPSASAGSRRQRRVEGGRGRRWNVRVSDVDADRLEEKAGAVGLSVPRFLVSSALDRQVRLRSERRAALATLLAVRAQLAGEANNLNQLARWANEHEGLPSGLDELLVSVGESLAAVDAAVAEVRRS